MLKISLSVYVLVFIFALACYVAADDQDVSASLLYCDEDVRNFSLSSRVHSLLMSGIEKPKAVDYHLKSKVFFWADNNHIYKAPLWQEGAHPSVLIRGARANGLSVDWIHDLIYWTTWFNPEIRVSRLDGSMVRTILKGKDIWPKCIAINPAEGFMFFSHFGGDINKIERCNMDGTSRKVIIKEDISSVESLTIDLGSQRIFWVDFNKDYVSSAKFDGHHRINLITQLQNPRSIDIYGQSVYFIAYPKYSGLVFVYKASKENGSDLTKVFDGKEALNSLKILDLSKQLEGFNVCGDNNGGCSHLCLPTSGRTFSCACPDDRNMSSDNFTCLNPDGSLVTTPSSTTNAPSSQLPFTILQTNFTSSTGSEGTTPNLTTNATSSQLPFTVSKTNFTSSTGSSVSTSTLNTKTSSSQLPFTVTQTNFISSTEANKNIDATVLFFSNHGTLVIASLTLIAMFGMMIYVIKIVLKTVANSRVASPVQKKRCEANIYMEAPL